MAPASVVDSMGVSPAAATAAQGNAATATPDAASAVAEWRAQRAELMDLKTKLQRARGDNTKLLHELKSTRRQLEERAKELDDARGRASAEWCVHSRLQGRLDSAEQVQTSDHTPSFFGMSAFWVLSVVIMTGSVSVGETAHHSHIHTHTLAPPLHLRSHHCTQP